MADNDEYDEIVVDAAGDDEGQVEATTAPKLIANLLLRQTFGSATLRAIRRCTVRSIVLEVPTAGWVLPIASAVRQFFPDSSVVGVSERNRFQSADGTYGLLTANQLTIGISQTPDLLLPRSLVSTRDLRLQLVTPTGTLIRRVARRCLRGRPGPEFDELVVAGLEFEELCAALPRGGTVKQSLARLRLAILAKSASRRSANVPALAEAHGYGEARDWALDLQQDLADLRAGRISAEELDRGAIFFGPSGTGKSLLAQIIAKACDVPFVAGSMGDLFQNAGDLGAVLRAQRTLFERARSLAPAILFIDEIDGLPNRAKLSSRGRDWWMPVVNDFLVQLDSAVSDRPGLVVIGATNAIADVDEALLRKQRLERAIYIGPPDVASLAGILRYYLGSDLPEADLLALVQNREGATGADAEEWARAARRLARRAGRPMILEDLSRQVLFPDRRNREELRRAAIHEAGHAVSATLLSVARVERVSINRSRTSAGHTSFADGVGEVQSLPDLEDRVVSVLAGRAAEQVLCDGPVTTYAGGGDASDLAIATNLIAMWHCSFGLAGALVWRGPPDRTLPLMTMDPSLRAAVNADLSALFQRAIEIAEKHRRAIEAVAAVLLERRQLSGDELRRIMRDATVPAQLVLDPGDSWVGDRR